MPHGFPCALHLYPLITNQACAMVDRAIHIASSTVPAEGSSDDEDLLPDCKGSRISGALANVGSKGDRCLRLKPFGPNTTVPFREMKPMQRPLAPGAARSARSVST